MKNKLFSLLPVAYAATTQINVNAPKGSVANLGELISGLVTAAIVIAAVVALIFLVWGGIEWLTSGGDKTHTEKAQQRITNAVIGLAIVVASWAVIQLIAGFFGIDFANLDIGKVKTN